MADNELSFDSFIPSDEAQQGQPDSFEAAAGLHDQAVSDELASNPDVQALEGFAPQTDLSFEAAAGMEAPEQKKDFSQYDINLKYKSLPRKVVEALAVPSQKLAGQALKFAPEIKDAAISIADNLGVDTSNWSPVDQEKWKLYLKAPEVNFHDLTNLLIDPENKKARFITGFAADILGDPLTYTTFLGPTAKGLTATKSLEEGAQIAKLSSRLRQGETSFLRLGLGKVSAEIPMANEAAAKALDLAESFTTKALDMADNKFNGQARRGLYNFLTQTNDPMVGEHINVFNAMNNANDINISAFNNGLRGKIAALSPDENRALIKYLEKPYDVIASPKQLTSAQIESLARLEKQGTDISGLIPSMEGLKSDIRFNKFPLSQDFKDVADSLRNRLYESNVKLAEQIGAIDSTGRPTIGWSAIKEALPEEELMTRPTSYFPRQLHPEYKKLLEEAGIYEPMPNSGNQIFTDASRKQRQYRSMTADVAANKELELVNAALKEKGLPQYTGKIFEDDPLNAVVRYDMKARQHLERMKLEDKLVKLSKTEDEWKLMSPEERLKWQRYDAGQDVAKSSSPLVIGKKLDGRFMRQGDADRARAVLNIQPMDAFDRIKNSAAFTTRFLRSAALFSPTYFGNNIFGNAMMSIPFVPNRAALLGDWGKSLGIIRSYANRTDRVFDIAGELRTAPSIIEELASTGNWDANQAREFYEKMNTIPESIAASIDVSKKLYNETGKVPLGFNVLKTNIEFTNLYADNLPKLGAYINFRNAGYSKAAAGKAVQEILFNFQDASPALKAVRQFVPFVTYPVKMVPLTGKLIAKYPFLPSLMDATIKNAVSQNMDLDPISTNVVQDLAPVYARTLFDPMVANLLPGNNLVLSDLQSPVSTINNLMQVRSPGVMPAALMAFGIDPATIQRMEQNDFAQQLNDDSIGHGGAFGQAMKSIGAIAKPLLVDPVPKPARWLMSRIPVGESIFDDPYAAKVMDRVSGYRMLGDRGDAELGKYLTTQTFMRKFMPDYFEEKIVKSNPDFFRVVGSVARQHLKDVTLGFAKMTPLDGEMLIRNMQFNKAIQDETKRLGGLNLDSKKALDPNYRADDRKKIEANIKVLQQQARNLGLQYKMLSEIQKKYGTVIEDKSKYENQDMMNPMPQAPGQ
jgi:hypothetical protein